MIKKSMKNLIQSIQAKTKSLSLNKKKSINNIAKNLKKSINNIYKTKIIKPKLKSLNLFLLFQQTQDLIEKKFKPGQQEVILKQSTRWAESITWTFISGTILGIGWLSIAKTEEIAVVSGQLTPIDGVVEIQMPMEGVAKIIHVKEGERVEKGQVLLELDTEINKAKQLSLNENYEIKIKILDKLETLVKEGAFSEIAFLQEKQNLGELKSRIIENDVLLKYQRILSPSAGIVFDLKAKSPGFVARSTQPILKIVPTDNLLAEVEIDSRTIGFVSVGKKADISLDSFPATDFGVITGEVISIGSDALPPDPSLNKGYRFPARIKLDTQQLILKNGKQLELQAGMGLIANIKLRKVSYIQLLLDTFNSKADSLRSI